MKSWQVLKEAAETIGVKALASRLRLSPALVYKWCQEWSPDDPEASGARNPLDRLADVVEATQSLAVVNWLCHEAGGFFVSNPLLTQENTETELLRKTQALVREFSDLLSTVTTSIGDDGQIVSSEADLIRAKWEALKSSAEGFVIACEAGRYHGG